MEITGNSVPFFNVHQKYGYTHISAGDLLRAERNKEGTQYGELIDIHIKEGKIVPVEITINLLKRVRQLPSSSRRVKFLCSHFLKSF